MSQVPEAGGPQFYPPNGRPPATNAVPPLRGCECMCPFSVCICLLLFRLNIWTIKKLLQWVPSLDWRGLGSYKWKMGAEHRRANVINMKNCIWIIVFKYLANLSKSQRRFILAGILLRNWAWQSSLLMWNAIFNQMASSTAFMLLNYYTHYIVSYWKAHIIFIVCQNANSKLGDCAYLAILIPLLKFFWWCFLFNRHLKEKGLVSSTKAQLCLTTLFWCLRVLKHICHQHRFISHIRRGKGTLRLHFWHYVKSVIEHVCLCARVLECMCVCALRLCVYGQKGGGSSCCLVTSLRLTKEEQFRTTFPRNQYNRPDVMMWD